MEHRKWLSDYRDELKGIAILWVVLFHMRVPLGGILFDVQKIGYGGVDIFLFLTGFGLFHSLRKSKDLRGYISRRLRRVLPSYLPLILCWMLVMFPGYGLTTTGAIRSGLGNLLMVGFWFDVPKVFNWYISAFFLFMLLAPVFYGLLAGSPRPGRTLAALLAVSVGIGFCCIGDDRYMGISRLPIFLLGMAFAMDWRPKMGVWLKRGLYVLAFAAGLFVLMVCFSQYTELLNDYAMYWHPFVLMTPPLCVGLGFLFHKAEGARKVFGPLRLVGKASFEIYLMNIWAVELGKNAGLSGGMGWALLSLGSIALGIGYHLSVKTGVNGLKRRRIVAE